MDDVIGVPGAGTVPAGSHLCALYSGPAERDRILFPFLEEGLRAGNKCVCLVDQVEPEEVRAKIAGEAACRPRGAGPAQLDVDRASAVYVESGKFSSEHMLAFLTTTAKAAAHGAYPHLRAAGEMSWVLATSTDTDDYFVYEAGVNKVAAEASAVLMCLYDVRRFSVTMLMNVLRTHPKILLDGSVLDNAHYLTPDEYLATRREQAQYPLVARAQDHPDRWQQLTDAEQRVAGLVASGMSNKMVARHLTVSPHTIDAHLKHTYVKLDIHSRVELTVIALQNQ
jgi:DNA-binding CsgD family transcriptional regulator